MEAVRGGRNYVGAPPPVQAIRFPYRRTQNGCLVCRGRKKKCDGTKPTCDHCAKYGTVCVWPEITRRHAERHKQTATSTAGLQLPIDEECNRDTASQSSSAIAESSIASCVPSPPLNQTPALRLLGNQSSTNARHLSPFLENYLHNTCYLMATAKGQNNPFLTILLQRAHNNELLMNAILATSGVHLSLITNSAAFANAAWGQYGMVISQLRQLQNTSSWKMDEAAVIVVVMILLFTTEVICGNSDKAWIHLKACRGLVLRLHASRNESMSSELHSLIGTCLELYAYQILVTTITPPDDLEAQSDWSLDPFLSSLHELKVFDTFGTLFSTTYAFMELVPSMIRLRLQLEAKGQLSQDMLSEFARLEECCVSISPSRESNKTSEMEAKVITEVYRAASLIFLWDCKSLSLSADRKSIMQEQALVCLQMIGLLGDSSLQNICMWPFMVASSCLSREGYRDLVRRHGAKLAHFGLMVRAIELLELVWAAGEIGPRGILRTMRKHSSDLLIA